MYDSMSAKVTSFLRCRTYRLLLAMSATSLTLLVVRLLLVGRIMEASNLEASGQNSSGLLMNMTRGLSEYRELSDVLYFNRVPKTGSENMAYLISHLSTKNQFSLSRYPRPTPRHLTPSQQLREVLKVTNLSRPVVYDRHVHFLDFRKFDSANPLYFSMVREPADKFVSRFHYLRSPTWAEAMYKKLVLENNTGAVGLSQHEWRSKNINECIKLQDPECAVKKGSLQDLTIPYFCGQEPRCREVGSRWALETAMANVEQFYPVVGVIEDLHMTLTVLEEELPTFFDGVTNLYHKQLKDPHKNKQRRRRANSTGGSEGGWPLNTPPSWTWPAPTTIVQPNNGIVVVYCSHLKWPISYQH